MILINKNELLDHLKYMSEIRIDQLEGAIDRLPSMEIVRCKDCKHRYTFVTNETGTATHYYVCDFMDAQYEDEGYCHHGERSRGMTREEAIEIVKSAFSAWESEFRVPNDDWNEEHEALDMAIEALSAEAVEGWIPCDTSGMPPEGEAVLMSDGKHIWIDETVAWWGDRSDWIGTAWMPLPTPYKGGERSEE